MSAASATTALQSVPDIDAQILEKVMLGGDISQLTPAQRVSYYAATCKSLGLNPLTRPFDYLSLQGKLTLYARRECTEQLRSIHDVSVTITGREIIGDGVYVVSARATLPSGRTDESTGAVAVAGLKGEALANAYLKSETKAKRRVTLSICGLGIMDESEVASVQGARTVEVDHETGEIIEGAVVPHVPHPDPATHESKAASKPHVDFAPKSAAAKEPEVVKGKVVDEDGSDPFLPFPDDADAPDYPIEPPPPPKTQAQKAEAVAAKVRQVLDAPKSQAGDGWVPATPPGNTHKPGTRIPGKEASDKTKGLIRVLISKAKLDKSQQDDWLRHLFGVESIADLTQPEASVLIEHLKFEIGELF